MYENYNTTDTML